MKVLFLGSYNNSEIVPAPVKVSKNIFENLKEYVSDIKFITYFEDGNRYTRRQKLFGNEYLSDSVYRMGIFPLIIFVVKYKPVIIHLTNATAFYLIIFLLKPFLGFKVIYTFHSIIKYYLKYYNRYSFYLRYRFLLIEKIVSKYSDQLFVLNKKEKRYVQRYYAVPSKRISVVDNGVTDIPIKKIYADNNDKTKIIFVGDWSKKEKGFDILLESLSIINREFLLTVCSANRVENFNDEIPSNVNLEILPPLDEIELRKIFAKNDLIVCPSRYESFGLALLEAMNAGLLFICSNTVGLAERLPLEFKPFLIAMNCPNKLKKIIEYFLRLSADERNIRSVIGKNFSQNFLWKRISVHYYSIYKELLKG